MYDLGPYPCVIEQAGSRIYGEVFEVNEELLDLLDEVEGMEYNRQLRMTFDGELVWVYLWVAPGPPNFSKEVKGGVWLKK